MKMISRTLTAIVALAMGVAAVGCSSDAQSTRTPPQTVGQGEMFHNGPLALTVTDVEIGAPLYDPYPGRIFDPIRAHVGQLVVVTFTWRNDGNRPGYVNDERSTLVDDQGRHYTANKFGFWEGGTQLSFEEVQPGQTGEAVAVFDVPIDVTDVTQVIMRTGTAMLSNRGHGVTVVEINDTHPESHNPGGELLPGNPGGSIGYGLKVGVH